MTAVVLLAVPTALAAGPSGGTGPAVNPTGTTPPTGSTWAWGAASNVSIAATYVGAYNQSLNLTGGNLSSTAAFVAVNESAQLGYASYVLVHERATSTVNRSLEIQAIEARETQFRIAAQGTFPVAGTYGPNSTVPLAPTSFGLDARIVVVSAFVGFLNTTNGPNGSVGLTNEHVYEFQAINVSLVAVNFPNLTARPNGTVTLAYRTGAVRAAGYVAEELNASFSPPLWIVEAPLFVGKTWNVTSQVQLSGRAAYSAVETAVSGGSSYSQHQSGVGQVRASGTLAMEFAVTGATTVRYPNGTVERVYVVTSTDGTHTGQYAIWDGLLVLPGADPTHAAGIAAATSARPAAQSIAQGPVTSALESPGQRAPVSARAQPAPGSTVTAAPVAPEVAQAGMRALGTPSAPTMPPTSTVNVGAIFVLALAGMLIVGTLGYAVGRRRGRRVR